MPRPDAADQRRKTALTRALARTGFVLPGTLLERRMRCGKPGCRCTNDPPSLHGPYYQWTRKVDGKTITRLLTAEQVTHYQEWFANAKQVRELLTQLETLSLAVAEDAEGWS